jgi:hypothetical protein
MRHQDCSTTHANIFSFALLQASLQQADSCALHSKHKALVSLDFNMSAANLSATTCIQARAAACMGLVRRHYYPHHGKHASRHNKADANQGLGWGGAPNICSCCTYQAPAKQRREPSSSRHVPGFKHHLHSMQCSTRVRGKRSNTATEC